MSLILFSASVILFVASRVFLISFIIHYILTLISSRSLLNLSCIFSILVSRLFICVSILISRFWSFSLSLFRILYQVDSLSLLLLFGLVGMYPVFCLFVCFFFFTCWVFLCLFICLYWCVWGGLSVFWSSLYCEVSSLWVGLYGCLVKVLWLGKLVSGFWWVELDFFSLECNEVSSNELRDVNGFGVTLGNLYTEAQGCVPVLLENLHGISCSGTCWPLGGAWFQCMYGGVWWAPVN